MINLEHPSLIRKSKEFQERIQSDKTLPNLSPDMRKAYEQSIAIEETQKAYLRYYASKLKKKINQQNQLLVSTFPNC